MSQRFLWCNIEIVFNRVNTSSTHAVFRNKTILFFRINKEQVEAEMNETVLISKVQSLSLWLVGENWSDDLEI